MSEADCGSECYFKEGTYDPDGCQMEGTCEPYAYNWNTGELCPKMETAHCTLDQMLCPGTYQNNVFFTFGYIIK